MKVIKPSPQPSNHQTIVTARLKQINKSIKPKPVVSRNCSCKFISIDGQQLF